MTSAIPSPNATTRMNPKAGRPAAIEPRRISRALADGIRPPARPRTKRFRQVSVEPAGGRWLWAMPPWLCRPAAAGSCSEESSCLPWASACVVVLLVLVRVLVVVLGRVGRASAMRPAPAFRLGHDHPAADGEDRDGRDHRRCPNDEVRRQDPLRTDDQRGEDQDPDGVRQRHRQAQPGRMKRRSARADEIRRHQRLAMAGRQCVTRAKGRGGQQRDEQDDRRQVRGSEDRGQLTARNAAGNGASRLR